MYFKKKALFIIITLFCFKSILGNTDIVNNLPGLTWQRQQFSGYVKGLFYWYVPSKKENPHSPIILFTSGGPGSSSLYGFFAENGPYTCTINNNKPNFKLSVEHADWSTFSNYLVFDQPLGIGLSFASASTLPKTPLEGTVQYYRAIHYFFEHHPELKGHTLYLAGESYGATYIALLAQQLKQHPIKGVHLKGLIIISGWVDPIKQYGTMVTALEQHQLISTRQKLRLDASMNQCTKCLNPNHQCFIKCQLFQQQIKNTIPLIDLHNIERKKTDTWKKAAWIKCLNTDAVRHAIHVKSKKMYYPMTNIWDNYGANQLKSVTGIYKKMIHNGIRLLVFSGSNDISPSGYLGTSAWLQELHFKAQKNRPWLQNNDTLGIIKKNKVITWVIVNNAGHTVPTDQPKIKTLIQKFTSI